MTIRSYWSAIKNAHVNLNKTDSLGEKGRKAFLEASGSKNFTEKRFLKQRITKKEIISAYAKIKIDREKLLKKAWITHTKRNIKLRNNTKAFKKFKDANRTKIFEEIDSGFEMFFDSPDVIA